MGTRMKGLLKGLRYISNIFEEEKEHEMQIGLPTDVKHVAHIGWDGPKSNESPSWMKEYNGGGVVQSAPLHASGQARDDPQVKWVSQDSSKRKSKKSAARDLPELPKSSRRLFTDSSEASPSPKRNPSKSRSSRRHQHQDSEGSCRSIRRAKEPNNDAPLSPSSPTSRQLAESRTKSRRRKSKESSLHRTSKSKDKESSSVSEEST